jgi:glycosyltransferase involved in cell wall biosynthesis
LLHVHSGVREADGTFHGTVTNADGADAVVAVSNAVAASVTGLPVTVIHPGVPIPDLAARPSAPRGEFVIGAVGRLEPGKSYADLIRALPKLPHSVRLEIAGDGNAAEALQQLARDLGVGDRVTLLGWVQDLRRYYTRWSLFAHPSQSEGFAISILQAMAAGLPVIATSVGGTPEAIIDGESGLLVPVGQPDALAAAISRVVDDPNLGASLGGQARARVARLFSVEHQVDATERLYRALLSSARA